MEDLKQVRVFVGSPSDVSPCRASAKSAVELVGAGLESRGVILKPVLWEIDARPELGTDAQSTLNSQIVNNCDIYVFLFHTRLGSPTPRGRSGSVEELELALARVAGAQNVRVLVYFDQTPVPPTIDLKELQRLQDFRLELQAKGLVASFTGPEDLKDRLMRDLPGCVDALLRAQGVELKKGNVEAIGELLSDLNVDTAGEDEDDGVFEYEARLQQDVETLSVTFMSLGTQQRALSDEMEEMTAEMNALGSSVQSLSPTAKLNLIDGFAGRLEKHATEMGPTADKLSIDLANICGLTEGIVGEFVRGEAQTSAEDREGFAASVGGLLDQMRIAIAQLGGLESGIAAFPGFTKALKRSRNKLVAIYAKIRGSVQSATNRLDSALQRLADAA